MAKRWRRGGDLPYDPPFAIDPARIRVRMGVWNLSTPFPPRIDRGLGGPPRIEPLRIEQMTARYLEAIDNAYGFSGSTRSEPIPPFFATLCRHAEMFERYMAFGMNILNNSVLRPRDREVIVLRTGWLCDAPFEWGEHVRIGLDSGLAPDEIERIKIGPDATGWNERDRALLRSVDELHETAMIGDETWAMLEAHFDECQLIEVPFIVGQYHMTAFMQNSLRFRPGRDKHGEEVVPEEDYA